MVQTTVDREMGETSVRFGERVAEMLIGQGALELLLVAAE